MRRASKTSEHTLPLTPDVAPEVLAADRVARTVLRRPALTSWRPSAHLSAVERYGRFEILGRVGRGGMAEILLARERSLPGSIRHLVVKRILPEIADSDEMLHMFLAEARVVMGLSHPNLCQIYEVGEQEGSWFIAMEWVNGTTLHHLIKRAVDRKQFDYGVLARVHAQCAEALHHAHMARDGEGKPLHLVHRDVSPHNLMVAFDGRVKLLDFGIAKSTASTYQTETGVVKGKVCYMAPEQWLSGTLDGRTDVFALGACLYEALTGQIAFRRDTQGEVMRAVVHEPVPPIAEIAPFVPRALAEVAERALSKEPLERFQSAQEMSEALERFVGSLAEPVTTARVADYARQLFPNEVELGPVLERAVRGAQLETAMILPPMPRSAADLAISAAVSSRPSLPTTDNFMPVGTESMPAPSEALATPSRSPDSVPVLVDSTELDAIADFDALAPELLRDSEPPKNGPATFSDAPTRPRPGLPELEASGSPSGAAEARAPARTVSMRTVARNQWIALWGGLAAAAVLVAMLSHDAVRERTADTRAQKAAAVPAARQVPAAVQQPAAQAVERPAEVHTSAALAAPVSNAPSEAPTPKRVAAPAEGEGLLSINTRPWSTVYLGKRVLGTTPIAAVRVPKGALVIKLVDRDGRVHTRKIERSKDKTRSAFFDFEKDKK